MATFGKTTVGGSVASDVNGGYVSLSNSATLSGNGTATSMSAHIGGHLGAADTLRMVLYADSAGNPGTLLGVTDEVAISSRTWYTANFPSGIALTAGTYWLGIWDPSNVDYDYDAGGTAPYKPFTYSSTGSPPSPFGSPQGTNNQDISIYVTYTPASAGPPTNTVAPAVSGTAKVGSTLTTTNGTWTDDGSPTFTYQWQRDNSGGGSYSNISSATASSYTLVSADVACNIRCVVTDTDSHGSTPANSNALGPVASATGKPFLLNGHTGLGRIGSIEQWLVDNTTFLRHEFTGTDQLWNIESYLLNNPVNSVTFTLHAGADRLWTIESYLLNATSSNG